MEAIKYAMILFWCLLAGPAALFGHQSVEAFDCSFDVDMCGWTQPPTASLRWIRKSSPGTGDGIGFYLLLNATKNGNKESAVLISPAITWEESTSTTGCLSLWYNMAGDDAGDLIVAIDGSEETLFSSPGNSIGEWVEAKITAEGPPGTRIQIIGREGSREEGRVAIDNISTVPEPCPDQTRASDETTPSSGQTPPSEQATPPTRTPSWLPRQTMPPSGQATPSSDQTTPSLGHATPSSDQTTPSSGQSTPSSYQTTATPDYTSFWGQTTSTFPPLMTPVVTTPSTPPAAEPQATVFASFVRNDRFSCLRPTTACYRGQGYCQPTTGDCVCLQGAYGLECQVPGIFPPNGGLCSTNSPCVRGICYDYGYGPTCQCPDGYYGDRCENSMITVYCHRNGMVINVFPYGFNNRDWAHWRLGSPSLSNCRLVPVPQFTSYWPQFRPLNWAGFAGAFYHRDRCAGNALVQETVDSVRYSRDLYIPYGNHGPHPTDTSMRVTCVIPKADPFPAPAAGKPVLPPPEVTYSLIDQTGQPLLPSVQRGTTIGLAFKLQPMPNSAGATGLKVESCVISRANYSFSVVRNGCPVLPIGRYVVKSSPSVGVLWMSTADFPPGSLNWNFNCKIQPCEAGDTRCSQAPVCSI